MKILFKRIKLNLKHTFRIARSADDFRHSVIVRILLDDLDGLGESAPSPRYNQTVDTVERALSRIKAGSLKAIDYLEDTLEDLSYRLKDDRTALAGIDLALYDILGNAMEWADYVGTGFSLDGNEGKIGEALTDPMGTTEDDDTRRDLRGGAYRRAGCYTRSGDQVQEAADHRGPGYGFRPVRTVQE